MKELEIKTESKTYPIVIDDSFGKLKQYIENIRASKVCIITDTNVAPLYLEEVTKLFGEKFEVCSHTFEAGENSKHLDTIRDFFDVFIENHLDRKSLLIALGGGVVGDMTGFAAAVYMRGIRFIQIPTTLLAQVDSSVGGKTGVDYNGNKNMIGAFLQPELVYINTSTLSTLPYRQVAAGLAEALKYGYITDKTLIDYFKTNTDKIKALDFECISHIVYESCKCKAFVVGQDEKEQGLRAILNFGHTFGHAVESLYGFSLLHGECVAIGMCAALYYAYRQGNISKHVLDEAKEILKCLELPVKCELSADDIFEKMTYDKKTASGRINIVSLKKPGEAYIDNSFNKELIYEAIKEII